VYDASTKIPSGLVPGNIQQLGNYDQCLRIEVQAGDALAFRGQQCLATIRVEVAAEDSVNQTKPDAPPQLDMKDLFYAALEAAVSVPNKTVPSVLNVLTEQDASFC
jgi:hypothetical protein